MIFNFFLVSPSRRGKQRMLRCTLGPLCHNNLMYPLVFRPPFTKGSFLTFQQLSCQHPARLRFNEEKPIVSLVSVHSSWTFVPRPSVSRIDGTTGPSRSNPWITWLRGHLQWSGNRLLPSYHLLWLQTQGTSDLLSTTQLLSDCLKKIWPEEILRKRDSSGFLVHVDKNSA